jgi:branched-chain amino acid transport system permease protein
MNTSLGVRRRPKINIPLAKNAMSALIAIGGVLIVAPLILSNFQLSLFSTGVAYSVATLGAALGFASVGMLLLTQPAMMLIGGYVALYFVTHWELPFVVAATLATAAGMLTAVPLGWLTCRLDRYSFAVLGFAFTYLVTMLSSSSLLVDITGGELGKPFPQTAMILAVPLMSGINGYFTVSAIALAAFASAAIIFRSTMGRILVVMKQDDVVARTLGIDTNLHRISLTAIVSGYGALSGALIGQASGYISPPQFDVSLSILLLATVLVGGASYLLGAFVGTMILQTTPALLGLSVVDRDLAAGAVLLVCLAALPDGVLALRPLWPRLGIVVKRRLLSPKRKA